MGTLVNIDDFENLKSVSGLHLVSYASLHDRDSEPGGNGMSTQSIQAPVSLLTYTYNHMKLHSGGSFRRTF
jgi:hypothetical protein